MKKQTSKIVKARALVNKLKVGSFAIVINNKATRFKKGEIVKITRISNSIFTCVNESGMLQSMIDKELKPTKKYWKASFKINPAVKPSNKMKPKLLLDIELGDGAKKISLNNKVLQTIKTPHGTIERVKSHYGQWWRITAKNGEKLATCELMKQKASVINNAKLVAKILKAGGF